MSPVVREDKALFSASSKLKFSGQGWEIFKVSVSIGGGGFDVRMRENWLEDGSNSEL